MYSLRIGHRLAWKFIFPNNHCQGINEEASWPTIVFRLKISWACELMPILLSFLSSSMVQFCCSNTAATLECFFLWFGLWVILIVIVFFEWWLRDLKILMNWLHWWRWSSCFILLKYLRPWKVGTVSPSRIISIGVRIVVRLFSHHIDGTNLI